MEIKIITPLEIAENIFENGISRYFTGKIVVLMSRGDSALIETLTFGGQTRNELELKVQSFLAPGEVQLIIKGELN